MDSDLIFLATSRTETANSYIDKHLVGYATIQYMERGAVTLAYDGEEETLQGAWFWPAYPGPHLRFHAGPQGKSWFHRHLAFQGPLFERWRALDLWPLRAQQAPASRTAQEWGIFFDTMMAHSKHNGRLARLRTINMLESLLLELAEIRTAPAIDDLPWLRKVLSQLKNQKTEHINYAALAHDLGMSEGTLRRQFKFLTGVPIHTYVLQQRILEAKNLLGETDLPIKNIANTLGYQNVYFFSRQFKQFTGASPAQYRQSGALRGS